MLVKRNVYFSAIDENGEERLYSTNEVISEEDYLEMLFSDNENDEDEDEDKGALADAIAAAKGAGAGLGTVGLGAAGLYGTKKAKKATDKAVSKAVADKVALLKGEIAGDFNKLDAAHEKAAKASRRVNKLIKKSGIDWINNEEGKTAAEVYKAKIAGKSGAAKAAMEKKLEALEKAANKVARNRKIGVGLAVTGLGATAGYGVHKVKSHNRKKSDD